LNFRFENAVDDPVRNEVRKYVEILTKELEKNENSKNVEEIVSKLKNASKSKLVDSISNLFKPLETRQPDNYAENYAKLNLYRNLYKSIEYKFSKLPNPKISTMNEKDVKLLAHSLRSFFEIPAILNQSRPDLAAMKNSTIYNRMRKLRGKQKIK
jgi:hypothetical protein